MPLAAEWKKAPAQLHVDPRHETQKRAQKARKSARASMRHRIIFVCFIGIAVMISGLLTFSVFLRVMVAQNEIRAREVERQIELERRQQESLRLEIAGLESPARIERIAVESLRMTRVPWAEYVQTSAYKAARSSERERLSDTEATANAAAQGG